MAVEIKRTRAGQGVLNKPIGVVRLASGEDKVLAQKAEALGSIANTFFQLEETRQVKAGKDFAEKVQALDENGEVVYHDPPSSLGKIGYETAQQELNKKYAVALKEQSVNTAIEFRQLYRTEEEFSRNFSTWMEETAKNLSASGGGAVASAFLDDAALLRQRNIADIKTQKFNQEQELSRSQYELDIRRTIAMVGSYALNGDFEEAQTTAQLVLDDLDNNAMQFFNMTGEKRRELTNILNDQLRNGRIQNAVKGYSYQELVLLEAGVESGVIPEAIKKDMPWLEDFIEETASETARRNTLNTFLSSLREAKFKQQQVVSSQLNVQNLMSSGFPAELTKANQDDLDLVYASFGINAANMFSQVGKTRDALFQTALDAPFASSEMVRAFDSLKFLSEVDDAQIRNAVDLYRNISTKYNGNLSAYGLKDQAGFLIRLDSLMQNYGDDPQKALAFARRIPQNKPEDLATLHSVLSENFSTITESGEPMKDMQSMMIKYLKEENKEILPEHVAEMADFGIAVALSDPANLDSVVTGAYRQNYVASKYIRPSIVRQQKGVQARSRYAPEAFLDREQLKVFDAQMNNLLLSFYKPEPDVTGRIPAYKKPILGVDYYLDVEMGANNTAQYKFVRPDGTPMYSANGTQVSFGAAEIKQFMDRRIEQEKDEAIRKHNLIVDTTPRGLGELSPQEAASVVAR